MEYHQPSPTEPGKRSAFDKATKIHLDYATPDELKWWRAVTCPVVGWSIEGDQIAPLAAHMLDTAFEFVGPLGNANSGVEPGRSLPPAAAVAAEYLLWLCHAFGLGDRLLTAGLAAALAIAFLSDNIISAGPKIELPPPRLLVRPESRAGLPAGTPADFPLIGRYMSLSLSRCLFGAALWGPFCNPSVPCNYAGAWLGPIAAAVETMVQIVKWSFWLKLWQLSAPK